MRESKTRRNHLKMQASWTKDMTAEALNQLAKELLLGKIVNTKKTVVETAETEVTPEDITMQAVYMVQQQLDGYDQIVRHAVRRKAKFDKRVLERHKEEVTHKKGDLVQV